MLPRLALFARSGPPPGPVLFGELTIDRDRRRATIAGHDLNLTRRECQLLTCLADHANRVVRRSDLMELVWMQPDDDTSNLVAVYIRRIRQKLGPHAAMVKTVRGTGYRLRAPAG